MMPNFGHSSIKLNVTAMPKDEASLRQVLDAARKQTAAAGEHSSFSMGTMWAGLGAMAADSSDDDELGLESSDDDEAAPRRGSGHSPPPCLMPKRHLQPRSNTNTIAKGNSKGKGNTVKRSPCRTPGSTSSSPYSTSASPNFRLNKKTRPGMTT